MTKFTRHAAHRKKRLGDSWRKPRGWQNKMRLSKKGHRPKVRVGYRTAKSDRFKKKGLEVITVYNLADVEAVDAKSQGVVIGSVGKKKKIALLKAVQERKLTLLTGDAAKQQKALEDAFALRKKVSVEREKAREEKQKRLEEEAKKQEAEQQEDVEKEDVDAEEQKKEEDKEKEKVLTKAR